ncbi:cobalt-precorrin 5A hydrolase [Blautia sp. HCP3S3_H10_1]|uniref:cobalt-precorrin 5A hydrolase n=1 Tax=unclassified Blautia TaxID=2648079 RepID=UPI003F8EEAA7|nr:cobalt-precorrin 5A hydrolase [Clostridia bacterium]
MKGKRMKISMICYTLTGQQTGEKLKKELEKEGHLVSLFTKSKYIQDSIKESCRDWTKEQFESADSIIFIGATGIAVRSIAPFVQSKKKDPAVLVVDECGKFVISLLSGHLGGANELAHMAADILKAIPVVTTATDLEGKFAVDVFAKKNNCHIFRMKEAKEVSAALLAGEKVGFYSEFPWDGKLPDGLIGCKAGTAFSEVQVESAADKLFPEMQMKTVDGSSLPKVGIAVTIHKNCIPFLSTTHVVPPAVVLGMGCRKNKEPEAVESAAYKCLEKNEIYPEAVAALASIDVKKEEPGLLGLAEKLGVPFETYSSEQLLAVQGDFTPSSFVSQTVGVDNVCERSAVKAAKDLFPCRKENRSAQDTKNISNETNNYKTDKQADVTIIQRKHGAEGVTTALALGDWRFRFE